MPLTVSGPIHSDWQQALHSSDSAWLMIDGGRGVIEVNDGFTRMFGYSAQDMGSSRALQKLLGTGDELPPHISEQLLHNGSFCGELQVFHQQGHSFWVSATINTLDRAPLNPDTTVAAAQVMVFHDIGFTKKFEAFQRQMLESVVQEQPLSQMLHDMCVALEQIAPQVHVCVMEVTPDNLLQPLAAPSLPLYVLDTLKATRPGANHGACSAAAFLGREVITPHIAQNPEWDGIAHLLVQAGLHACWSSPITNSEGKVIGTLAMYFETQRTPNALHRQLVNACRHLCTLAMEREANKHRIQQLAYFDVLTQLPNRTMFNECAQQTLHAYRGQTGLLFFLDLDRFKLWNDSLGHAAGDALLCEVARRLSECTRPEDVVGRLSSDEFAVLMPSCSPEHIPQLAQRMLDAVAKPFSVQGVLTTPNACIGVCSFPEDGTDVETLLRHADQAMYVAKRQGSQHWERYQPVMGQLNQERAHIERDLRHTLVDGGLQLFFQPQVRGAGAQGLYGLEALARWHHPEWGWVSPPRFIAVAEDTGMIHDLTTWLLHAACAQLVLWRAQGVLIPHISINLSTNNFHDPTFAQKVQSCLLQHGLDSSDLVLEITENVMLDSSHATQNNLQALHAAGLRLAMDDFGTGYSSLSYLHRLPISELKLDKSFVHDVTTSSAASALTQSVLNIATSLGMTVVAEGVETADQAHWLRQHGCPVLQGYFFARPMPPEELPAWLETAFMA